MRDQAVSSLAFFHTPTIVSGCIITESPLGPSRTSTHSSQSASSEIVPCGTSTIVPSSTHPPRYPESVAAVPPPPTAPVVGFPVTVTTTGGVLLYPVPPLVTV